MLVCCCFCFCYSSSSSFWGLFCFVCLFVRPPPLLCVNCFFICMLLVCCFARVCTFVFCVCLGNVFDVFWFGLFIRLLLFLLWCVVRVLFMSVCCCLCLCVLLLCVFVCFFRLNGCMFAFWGSCVFVVVRLLSVLAFLFF